MTQYEVKVWHTRNGIEVFIAAPAATALYRKVCKTLESARRHEASLRARIANGTV